MAFCCCIAIKRTVRGLLDLLSIRKPPLKFILFFSRISDTFHLAFRCICVFKTELTSKQHFTKWLLWSDFDSATFNVCFPARMILVVFHWFLVIGFLWRVIDHSDSWQAKSATCVPVNARIIVIWFGHYFDGCCVIPLRSSVYSRINEQVTHIKVEISIDLRDPGRPALRSGFWLATALKSTGFGFTTRKSCLLQVKIKAFLAVSCHQVWLEFIWVERIDNQYSCTSSSIPWQPPHSLPLLASGSWSWWMYSDPRCMKVLSSEEPTELCSREQ